MKNSIGGARVSIAVLAAAMAMSAATLAKADGTYKRPNGDAVQVSQSGGKLYCKVIKNGFEMCHGMAKVGGNTWKGANMKHPDMPGFMTFNGTVTDSGSSIEIKGCAVGEAMCDAETWARSK